MIGEGTAGGDGGFDAQRIYQQEAPGVVTVVSLFGGDQLEDLGDQSGGVGSGFVLNGKGEIATNAHVVTTGEVPDLREAREVYVEFADGNQVPADVRGYDPESDIALLKIDPARAHAPAAAAGPLRRRRGRDAGRGDRLAVLREAVAVGRRRVRRRPLDLRPHGVPDLRARSRPTRRSTPATRAARSSTRTAA